MSDAEWFDAGEAGRPGDAHFYAYFPKPDTYGLIVKYRTVRINATWTEQEVEGTSTRDRLIALFEHLPEAVARVYREHEVRQSLNELDGDLDTLFSGEEEVEDDE